MSMSYGFTPLFDTVTSCKYFVVFITVYTNYLCSLLLLCAAEICLLLSCL